jgi:hypothetical protein
VCPFEWSTPFANGFERFTNKNLIKQMQLFNPMLINKKRQIIYLYVLSLVVSFHFSTRCSRHALRLSWETIHVSSVAERPRRRAPHRCRPEPEPEASRPPSLHAAPTVGGRFSSRASIARSILFTGSRYGFGVAVICTLPKAARCEPPSCTPWCSAPLRRPPHQSLPRWTAALCPRRPP